MASGFVHRGEYQQNSSWYVFETLSHTYVNSITALIERSRNEISNHTCYVHIYVLDSK